MGLRPMPVTFAVPAGACLLDVAGRLQMLAISAAVMVLLRHILIRYQSRAWSG
ncbi:MAG: hypothetical protein ACYDEV_05555 [Acidiferrobacter sp.]